MIAGPDFAAPASARASTREILALHRKVDTLREEQWAELLAIHGHGVWRARDHHRCERN